MKKIDWDYLRDATTAMNYAYSTATTNSINNEPRRIDRIVMEKKTRGVSFDKLEKTLREMGIFLTEIRQDSYNDYAEITCRVNPIDWYISLDKEDTPAMKDGRPHPKKVIFSGPATTILWTDGTKTTVKCQRHDIYDKYTGITMCYLKKMLGNEGNYNNIFREAMKVAVAAEPKTKDAPIAFDFDNMSEINKIKKCVEDAANTLSKIAKEKK